MLKNFQDRKCAWGYITLCPECRDYIATKPIGMSHVDANIEVQGFPIGKECENCGKSMSEETMPSDLPDPFKDLSTEECVDLVMSKATCVEADEPDLREYVRYSIVSYTLLLLLCQGMIKMAGWNREEKCPQWKQEPSK